MINVTLSICFCFVFGSFAVREENVKIVVMVPSVVLSIYKNIGNFKRFNSRFCLLLRGYRLIRTSYAEIYHKLQNQNLFSKIMFNQHI